VKYRHLVLSDGGSIHTVKWLEGLAQTGMWDLSLISMNPAPVKESIYKIPGVSGIHRIAPSEIKEAGNNYGYFYNLPRIYKTVREIDPHVISTLYLTSYGLMGSIVKGSAKLCHFVVGNDVMVTPGQGALQKAISVLALKRAEFVVSASKTMTQRLTETLHYPEHRILTQQYGVGDWIIDHPVVGKKFDFVSNRAWIVNSNIDYVLQILKRAGPKAKTALIGKVVPGSEELGAKIEKLAAEIPGCQNLGTMPYEQNIETVASGRFLLSLTTSDGASLSVMEAMALGVIPVLSDTEPNREWVVHGENGFLIPLNDLDRAVETFSQVLRLSPEREKQMAEKNKAIILERGSLSRNMKRVSVRLKDLVENPRAGSEQPVNHP
jgi:glycosyltransferase involved in cell wall biosynthesis